MTRDSKNLKHKLILSSDGILVSIRSESLGSCCLNSRAAKSDLQSAMNFDLDTVAKYIKPGRG